MRETILHYYEEIETIHTLETKDRITFKAKNIEPKKAKIGIYFNSYVLEYSYCNYDDSTARNRLLNSAISSLSESIKGIYPEKTMRHDFRLFCITLWDRLLETVEVGPIAGDASANPITFLADPYILQGGGTILYSPPGKGKSYTGMLMAVAIDSGNSTFWPVNQKRVAFINLERSARSIARRLECVNLALGEDPNRELICINQRGSSLGDIRDIIRKCIDRYSIDCIILDSISRAAQGDLNENRSTNALIDTLNSLCETWLALAHTPRSDSSHVYGSVHFEAGADIMLRMMSEESPNRLGIALKITKANDLPPKPIQVFSYEFDTEGLIGVSKARLEEFPELLEGSNESVADQIATALTNVGRDHGKGATATELSELVGRSRASIVAALQADQVRFFRLTKLGKNQPYGVNGVHKRPRD